MSCVTDLANADALSRLPLPASDAVTPPPLEVLLLEMVPDAPMHAERISNLTLKDPIMSRVLRWVLHGWPADIPDSRFRPFNSRRHELSAHKNCVLWGSRVVVPSSARREVLAMLHDAHPGIVHMKGLARSYVWWPGMDGDIEETVKACEACQMSRHAPTKAKVHPWEWTTKRWSRLHIDFAGPFQGKVFLIVVDAHSKWLEVSLMSSMSSSAVINTLRLLFATHGLPDVIVSDNGAAFTSTEFQEFADRNGIRHATTAPYHPSSNGQTERMVQTTKEALSRITQGEWQTRLARFLLSQHVTPNSSTGKSPAELLMNRRLTTALDRLHPDHGGDMLRKQELSAEKCPGTVREFKPHDLVYLRSYTRDAKWIPGVIIEVTGPLSYKVRTSDGQVHRRHVDQLLDRVAPSLGPSRPKPDGYTGSLPKTSEVEMPELQLPAIEMENPGEEIAGAETMSGSPPSRRYPVREHRPPRRFSDFVDWGKEV